MICVTGCVLSAGKKSPTAPATSGPDWREEFERAAQVKPLVGSETVIAERLQGVQPAVLIVRYDARTVRVTPDWRAVDCRTGTIYQIKSVADQDRRRAWLTMMAQTGVAG